MSIMCVEMRFLLLLGFVLAVINASPINLENDPKVNNKVIDRRQFISPLAPAQAYPDIYPPGAHLDVYDRYPYRGDPFYNRDYVDPFYNRDHVDPFYNHDAIRPMFHPEMLSGVSDIHLVGGDSEAEGTVELFANGRWGTICSNGWDNNDATVVCRYLGYPGGMSTVNSEHGGLRTRPILVDNVACIGDEPDIRMCRHSNHIERNCDHRRDAGVSCTGSALDHPGNLMVRLSGGTTAEGRVEVQVMDMWRSVCDDAWDRLDAAVVCHQLGFPMGGEAVPAAYVHYGYGESQVWLDEVRCTGLERSLDDCRHEGFGVHDCDGRTETAGVRCYTTGGPRILPVSPVLPVIPFLPVSPLLPVSPVLPINPVFAPTSVAVRLTGGPNRFEGRVEVNVLGQWMSVCADHFEHPDADVVCRMLGFPHGDMVPNANDRFGPGVMQVWMDDVTCTGYEQTISQCPHRRAVRVADCNGLTRAAGAVCDFDVPASGPHVGAIPPPYMRRLPFK